MAYATKKRIADALIQLLENKKLDSISIKEISELCGLNRQTFYYNFHDIYDLVNWIIVEKVHGILESSDMEKDWKKGFMSIIDSANKNRKILLNMGDSLNRRDVRRFLQDYIYGIIKPIVLDKASGMSVPPSDVEFVIQLFTHGFIAVIFEWFDYSGENKDIIEKSARFLDIIDGSTEYMLTKLSANQ